MRAIYFIACLSISLAGFTNPALSQPVELSEEAQISLITILPGEAPEEWFGHSAVRVKDQAQNIDYSFNYGTFQFDTFFLPKFIYGELTYFLSVADFSRAVQHYRERERPIIEQVLRFSPDQKQALFEFLQNNARPENRYYQYDFLFDNCSTRIRDALVEVLGDDILFAEKPDPQLTFRQMIDLYVDDRPFYDFGIDLVLGSRIDRVAEPWETMFLPDYLLEAFDHATVYKNNEQQPLVASKDTLMWIDGYQASKESLPWVNLITWTLFIIGAIVTIRNYYHGRLTTRWFDIPLFTISGLIGLIIAFLWFISLHQETVNNINLFWAWPTHLLVIPLLFRMNQPGSVATVYLIAAGLAPLIIALGWYLWPQSLHSAAFPLLILLILRCSWIALQPIFSNSKTTTEKQETN